MDQDSIVRSEAEKYPLKVSGWEASLGVMQRGESFQNEGWERVFKSQLCPRRRHSEQ